MGRSSPRHFAVLLDHPWCSRAVTHVPGLICYQCPRSELANLLDDICCARTGGSRAPLQECLERAVDTLCARKTLTMTTHRHPARLLAPERSRSVRKRRDTKSHLAPARCVAVSNYSCSHLSDEAVLRQLNATFADECTTACGRPARERSSSSPGATCTRRPGPCGRPQGGSPGDDGRTTALPAAAHDRPAHPRQAALRAGAAEPRGSEWRPGRGLGPGPGCADPPAREAQVRGHLPASSEPA